MKKISLTLIICILIVFISGCESIPHENTEDVLHIQYFYENICGSCDPETEFMEKFETLTGISRRTPNIKIEMYNVYDEDSKDIWDNVADEFGKSDNESGFPVLRIADDFKFLGDIEKTLSEGEINSKISEKELIILNNASVVMYFSSPSCHDCLYVEENIISKLPNEILISNDESPVQILKFSSANSDDLKLLKTYFDYYGLSKEEQVTPIVFVGYKYLSGSEEICKLSEHLNNGEGLNTLILKADKPTVNTLSEYGWFGVFITGLLNGLNPCAISMVLMLLSILVVNKKLIVPVGLSFAVGKFIGFLLLGTLLYSLIEILPLDQISSITKILLLALSVIMMLLNLNDMVALKNEKYQKIKLQLPKSSRKRNHEWIKKFILIDKPRLIILGGVILGLLLSAGEFLCTGQIYLAVIIQVINFGVDVSMQAFWYLITYCVAFILPLIIIIILVSAGRRVFDLSDKFRRNMTWIKLGNMTIFMVFFILVLFFY